jgi:hypothetical protein
MDGRVADEAISRLIQFDRLMLGVHTAIPGVIVGFDYDSDTQTYYARCQPAIKMRVTVPGQPTRDVELPVIERVPVCLPHSRHAGLYVTVPIVEGDECLLVFSERAIDNFLKCGGVQPQPQTLDTQSARHHDLTDCICIPGIYTLVDGIQDWTQDAVELRNKDGSIKVSVKTDRIDIVGDIYLTGSLTATDEVKAKTIALTTHVHGGVEGGENDTGEPVP